MSSREQLSRARLLYRAASTLPSEAAARHLPSPLPTVAAEARPHHGAGRPAEVVLRHTTRLHALENPDASKTDPDSAASGEHVAGRRERPGEQRAPSTRPRRLEERGRPPRSTRQAAERLSELAAGLEDATRLARQTAVAPRVRVDPFTLVPPYTRAGPGAGVRGSDARLADLDSACGLRGSGGV